MRLFDYELNDTTKKKMKEINLSYGLEEIIDGLSEKHCEKCGAEHDGSYGSGRFCSKFCARSFSTSKNRKEISKKTSEKLRKEAEVSHIVNPFNYEGKISICERCFGYHDGLMGSGRFCSLSCANGKDISKMLLRANKKYTKICITCGKEYKRVREFSSNFCSAKCNPKIGGYREGSGRSIHGYYKGIFSASTYELVWIIYALDHDIKFERFQGILELNGFRYIPDFLLEDGSLVEVKGFYTPAVDKKTKIAKELGYEIKVLYKEDMEHMFEYVKKNYEYKHIEELYDDYKPRFEYVCCYCGKIFYRKYKKKTSTVYCSRKCGGMGVIMNYKKEVKA